MGPGVRAGGLEIGSQRAPRLLVANKETFNRNCGFTASKAAYAVHLCIEADQRRIFLIFSISYFPESWEADEVYCGCYVADY